MMLDAAYLRAETKDTKAAAQQPNEDARIPYYVEQQYSPGNLIAKIQHFLCCA